MRFIRWPEPRAKKESEPKVIVARGRDGSEFIIGRNAITENEDRPDNVKFAARRSTYSEWVGHDPDGWEDVDTAGFRRPLNSIVKRYDYDLDTFQESIARESRKLVDKTLTQPNPDQRSHGQDGGPAVKRSFAHADNTVHKRQKHDDLIHGSAEAVDVDSYARQAFDVRVETPAPPLTFQLLTKSHCQPVEPRRQPKNPPCPLTISSDQWLIPGNARPTDTVDSNDVGHQNWNRQAIDAHMMTHLSFKFFRSVAGNEETDITLRTKSFPSNENGVAGNDQADIPPTTKSFPFNEDDVESMHKLRSAAIRAGTITSNRPSDHDQMLTLKVPGLQLPVLICIGDKTGEEFAEFREALRGASCWKMEHQGVTGDCVVEARELRVNIR